MNLLEGLVRSSLYIDFNADITYGADQMYLDYPVRFATVHFELTDTKTLSSIADRIRIAQGKDLRPMNPTGAYSKNMCDLNGWYDFYIGLNDYSSTKVDSCIEFIVISEDAPDNEELYTIDLNEAEQRTVYERLNEQCLRQLGKSCLDLLGEARVHMNSTVGESWDEAKKELFTPGELEEINNIKERIDTNEN